MLIRSLKLGQDVWVGPYRLTLMNVDRFVVTLAVVRRDAEGGRKAHPAVVALHGDRSSMDGKGVHTVSLVVEDTTVTVQEVKPSRVKLGFSGNAKVVPGDPGGPPSPPTAFHNERQNALLRSNF